MTASRRVYLSLRERIVEMELLPGTRIVEKALAEEFGTSRTPVHEAVQRLAEEGSSMSRRASVRSSRASRSIRSKKPCSCVARWRPPSSRRQPSA